MINAKKLFAMYFTDFILFQMHWTISYQRKQGSVMSMHVSE